MSRHAPLSDETIWSAISLQDETTWGCRWAEQTRFAVLDVDETSEYHNELGLARLKHVLSSVGLTRLQLHQSSESGGWHIYLSFTDWVNAEALHTCLKEWLRKEGFEIRAGQLEIFPSNNGLRLPLQRGFAWLDDQGVIKVRREDITAEEAVGTFCHALVAAAHVWQTVQERIKSRLEQIGAVAAAAGTQSAEDQGTEDDGFSGFFTSAGMIPEVYEAGRQYWANGLTGPSQRHHAILAVGHYLWYGDESAGVRSLPGIRRAKQRAEAIEAWLKEKHNGHSETVLKGAWNEICADIRGACNWEASGGREAPRRTYLLQSDRAIDRAIGLTKAWGVTCQPKHFEKGNIGREEAAREKIRAALVQLLGSNRRVTVVGLSRLSGCKKETVRRHVDIWGIFRLPKGPGDLSLGAGVSLPSVVDASGPVAACSEVFEAKEFFDPVLCEADSGDLDSVQDSCSGELAPIVLAPPFLLPGYEPTSEPPASRPSPAGSFGSLDAGSLVRWYSGRTADGAGGLEPSCDELPGQREILPSLMGLLAVTTCNFSLFAASGDNSALVRSFGILHYECAGFDSACRQLCSGVFGILRYRVPAHRRSCIRVNSPRDKALRISVYSGVRGPPKCLHACHASFSDVITAYGATDQKVCRADKCHRLACLQNVQRVTQSDVSR